MFDIFVFPLYFNLFVSFFARSERGRAHRLPARPQPGGAAGGADCAGRVRIDRTLCLSGRTDPLTTPLRGAVPSPLQGEFGPQAALSAAFGGEAEISGWCRMNAVSALNPLFDHGVNLFAHKSEIFFYLNI